MKLQVLAVLVLSSLSFVACGGEAKAGETNVPSAVDKLADKVADKTAVAGKMAAVTSTLQGVLTSLDGLKDPAAAEQAKAGLEAQIGKLKDLVGQLDASQLGDLWTTTKVQVQKLADEQLPKLVEKYKANPELQKAVAPYVEQLKGLFAGK